MNKMSNNGIDLEQEILLNLKDFLRSPAKEMLPDRISDCEVKFSFKVDGMSDNDLKKLFKIERLLSEIGVDFVRGMGFGQRDWFLQGDMGNAWVRGVKCTVNDQQEKK